MILVSAPNGADFMILSRDNCDKMWFEVVVPVDASSVQIDVNAVAGGEMPAGPTSMLDVGVVTQ